MRRGGLRRRRRSVGTWHESATPARATTSSAVSTRAAPSRIRAWLPLWRPPSAAARYGHHLTALLEGEPGSDERPALERRLDHHDAEGQPADDAVAAREVVRRAAACPGRQLGDDRAAAGNHLDERRVLGRIDARRARSRGPPRWSRRRGRRGARPRRCHGRDRSPPPDRGRRGRGPARRRSRATWAWRAASRRWRRRGVRVTPASPLIHRRGGGSGIAASRGGNAGSPRTMARRRPAARSSRSGAAAARARAPRRGGPPRGHCCAERGVHAKRRERRHGRLGEERTQQFGAERTGQDGKRDGRGESRARGCLLDAERTRRKTP